MGWGTRPALTPAQQYLHLQRNPSCAGTGTLGARGLVWRYLTRPTVLSREYAVRIEFDRNDIPKAFINSPDIEELAEGKELPHIYHDPVRLCLYLPLAKEWHASMRIDDTFVPWIATWLYYFEDWLACGEWRGGGAHPGVDDDEHPNRRLRRGVR